VDACLLVSVPSSCHSSVYFQYLFFVLVYFRYTTCLLAHCFALCEVLKTLAGSRVVELVYTWCLD